MSLMDKIKSMFSGGSSDAADAHDHDHAGHDHDHAGHDHSHEPAAAETTPAEEGNDPVA